ncbi:MAG: glutathione S-transferase family protein [Rhodospirillales bacterium]|nr:MAG: glutathione S-transferase family protein [Rhodospirillales bacterium]
MMLKVWGRKSSSNVQALMWCIGELNLAYERVDAGFIYGLVDTPEYLSMNPNGLVPTLQDGDDPPLWESGAILRYLANTYATDNFWPADRIGRADVDKWAEWSKINIALNFTGPVFWRVVRTPPSKRDYSAIRAALRRLNKFLDIAETRLSAFPYLTGEHFTLADIQFGHCLFRYFDIDIERAKHPYVRRYCDALTARPAFREHVMLSYEELRETD